MLAMMDHLSSQRPNRELFVTELETTGKKNRPTVAKGKLEDNSTIDGQADFELIGSDWVPSQLILPATSQDNGKSQDEEPS